MKTLTTKKAVGHFSPYLSLIKDNVKQKEPLKKNQYYCLMITTNSSDKDYYEKNYPDTVLNANHHCLDLGLERPGNDRIYLSKNFNKRFNVSRGRTLIVETENIKQFCIL